MSQYLDNMKLGDTIDVRGPSGRLQYTGQGTFLIKKLRKDPPVKICVKKLNMIAGNIPNIANLLKQRHIKWINIEMCTMCLNLQSYISLTDSFEILLFSRKLLDIGIPLFP
jgi:glutaredoxin-related protein